MADDRDGGGPVATRVGRALVVTLPRELDDDAVRALRTTVMAKLRQARTEALVFEASGLDMIDASEFRDLAAVARSATWLGVRPMLVGLSAGIVTYIVDAGLDTSAFEPYGTLDDALAVVAASARVGAGARPGDLQGTTLGDDDASPDAVGP